MADSKLSALTAVVTPASTDQFYVNQGGTSKMETRAQIHALESGEHLVLPQVSEVATPTLAFGDGDSGFFEIADDRLRLVTAGAARWEFIDTRMESTSSGTGAMITAGGATATAPVHAFQGDVDTGVGKAALDALSLISGAIEAIRFTEVSSHILQAVQANAGLTAATGSSQGDGPILSSFNEYTVVGTAGDAATLPGTFIVGTQVLVMNSAANSMDVFPTLGDDAGAGTDTVVAVAGGANALFFAVAANATWVTVFNA